MPAIINKLLLFAFGFLKIRRAAILILQLFENAIYYLYFLFLAGQRKQVIGDLVDCFFNNIPTPCNEKLNA